MKIKATIIHERLHGLGDRKVADASKWFFKTGPGQYGEGDQFIGIRVPQLRKLAGEYRSVQPEEALSLLQSPFHEARVLALLILVGKFQKAEEARRQIYQSYLAHTKFI